MKKRFLYIIAVGIFLSAVITSCNKEKDVNPGTIQMTTNTPGEVRFTLFGTGSATIDWGDGTAKETKTIFLYEDNSPTTFSHNFSGTNTRTIRIYGEKFTIMYCHSNRLTTLDVSNNTELEGLWCGWNQLTNLDVSGATALKWLSCEGNQLTTLNVSQNIALTSFRCSSNQLTTLNVSNNTELEELLCGGNRLTSLDVSGATALINLDCYYNQLTTLDVSNNTALCQFICGMNQLTNLDISRNTTLRWLQCQFNQLTNLHVSSNNTALVYINCIFNDFTAATLDALFSALPDNTDSEIKNYISIYDNPGTKDCDPSIATDKGWRVETIYTIE